jgi:putative ABC transport system permease protein
MIFFEFAKRNVRLHWLRSFLAVLGIIIGVVTISTIGIMGNSLVLSVSDSLSTVGDTIVVSPSTGASMGMGGGITNEKITDRQVEQIRRAVAPNIAIPVYYGGDRMTIGSETTAGVVYGIAPDNIPDLLEVEEGTFLRGSSGCMVGRRFADEHHLKVGSRIEVGDKGSLRVSGILKERGMGFDINPDYGIVVSDAWYSQAYDRSDFDQVIVKVRDLNSIEEVTQSIEKSLNRRDQVVNVLETKKVLETILTAFSSISTFVTAIGGISLIVAGVSIFNIMMMSVTERIREIGIMRSIGTQKRDVLKMFLYEALILGLVGSLAGGLLAFAGGYAVSSLLLNTTKYIFVPSSLVQVLYGMVFGIGTSLICGIYPAWKGSNLNPIEALRHD